MAIRAGMSNLVNRLRALTGAGTADYVAGTVTYWTDDHLQAALDSNSRFFVAAPLAWQQQQQNGTAIWLIAQAPFRDLEELASGTARWNIATGAGSAIGTALYTPDYQSGQISWGTVSQGGSAYYLTAYTYDIHAAAADIWTERLANFVSYFDFRADNQTFSRSQVFRQAKEMRALMKEQAGDNVIGATSGDLHVSEFVRTDINGWCWQ